MERGLHSFLSPLIATQGKLREEFGGGESGANDDQATRLWALLLTRSSGHENKVLYFSCACQQNLFVEKALHPRILPEWRADRLFGVYIDYQALENV